MAKQKAFGLYTGKLGESVGYRNTNGKVAGQIAVRQYQANVANPKTDGQASQRMKLKPAINFYRGLQGLLDHSWQGVKYGARSRSKFLSLVMSDAFEGFPYVDKGTTQFIPGEYPVSLGQVAVNTNNVFLDEDDGGDNLFWPSGITYGEISGRGFTFGQYSQVLISRYVGLQDGDELTFIGVYKVGNQFVPMHRYLVLDTNSLALATDVLEAAHVAVIEGGAIAFDVTTDDEILTPPEMNYPTRVYVAGAVIVSRHPNKNSSTWLRTTSYMKVRQSFRDEWMSADRLAAAKQTYRDSAADLSSDWLLNQSENLGGSALNPSTTYEYSFRQMTFGGLTTHLGCVSINGGAWLPVCAEIDGHLCGSIWSRNEMRVSPSKQFTDTENLGSWVDARALAKADKSIVVYINGTRLY